MICENTILYGITSYDKFVVNLHRHIYTPTDRRKQIFLFSLAKTRPHHRFLDRDRIGCDIGICQLVCRCYIHILRITRKDIKYSIIDKNIK